MLNAITSRLRRALVAVTLAFTLASFIPTRGAQAAAGDLDPTFGVGGKATTDFFGLADTANGMVVQSDGKIVLVGGYNGGGQGFALVRYGVNGSLDPTFGAGGKVTTIFSGSDGANALAQQADGKIIAAGSAGTPDGFSDLAFARYNGDGSLDTAFGTGGKLTVGAGDLDFVTALAMQPDNKIVALGESLDLTTGTSRVVIVRLNPDGSFDPGFGVGGKVVAGINGLQVSPQDVALQADGKIVVVGSANVPGFAINVFIERYTPAGVLDAAFGGGGVIVTNLGNAFAEARAVAVQPDNKILVAGSTAVFPNPLDFMVARFDAVGNPDPAFGVGGVARVTFAGNSTFATSIALQPDGKILLAGGTTPLDGRRGDFALARVNSDGTADLSFGANGKSQVDFFGLDDVAAGVGLQPNGKIVVAGYAFKSLQDPLDVDFAVARFNSSDLSFDLCLQDDSSGNLLRLNSATGDYLFTNCGGIAIGGTGTLTRRGSLITLQHNAADRRVLATLDGSTHRASASVQMLATSMSFSITDRNTTNNTCACK